MEGAVEETGEIVRSNLAELEKIWQRIGIPEHQVVGRRRDFVLHVSNLVTTMKNQEIETENRIMASIERSEKKLIDIKEKLQPLSAEEKSNLTPVEPKQNETPLEKDKRFKDEREDLDKIRKTRVEKITELSFRCRSLSDQLSEALNELATIRFGNARIPTNEEIKQLEEHCRKLNQIKKTRQQRFGEIRPNIAKWMRDLGESPNESFEINILMEPDEEFEVTDENMHKLEILENEIKERWNTRVEEIESIKKEITKMWDLMEVTQAERDEVHRKACGFTMNDLNLYRAELERLMETRRKSLRCLTEKAISDLKSARREARILPPEDENLCQNPSENLLNLIMEKFEEAKKLAEQRRPILAKMFDWTEKVNRLDELAMKAKDPSRLKNRGGNLLVEERKRKSLEKSLPKITAALMSSVESWEAKNGKFLIDGKTLEEYRTSMMMNKENERVKEQNEKKRKRQVETETEMRFGSTNPNKAKKTKQNNIKIKIDKSDEKDQVSVNSSTIGEAHLTPWGSMKYSPNKPPPGQTRSKQLTSVGKAIQQYASKVLPKKKVAKTTDNLASTSFENRKMRRRSKSLSCMRQDVLQRSTLKPFKAGARLPLPSCTDSSKLFTPRSSRQESSSLQSDALHGTILHADQTTIDLSETIEQNPKYLDQSVSRRIGNVCQREFVGELLGDRPKNARSSIIPSRSRR